MVKPTDCENKLQGTFKSGQLGLRQKASIGLQEVGDMNSILNSNPEEGKKYNMNIILKGKKGQVKVETREKK